MATTIEYIQIGALGVDSGQMSYFASYDSDELEEKHCTSTVDGHEFGLYDCFVDVDDATGRICQSCLIHKNYCQEFSHLKCLGEMPVSGKILIGDPCYSYANKRVMKYTGEPDYYLRFWGRDQKKFSEYLNSIGVLNENGRTQKFSAIEEIAHVVKNCPDKSLFFMNKIVPNYDLYNLICDNNDRIVQYIGLDDKKYFGVTTSSGFGDGIYDLYRIKKDNKCVGYSVKFF